MRILLSEGIFLPVTFGIGMSHDPHNLRFPLQTRVEESTPQEEWNGPVWRWHLPDPNVRQRLSPVRFHKEDPQSIIWNESATPAKPRKEPDPDRLSPPSWLEGSYRPKALTWVGVQALELLGPGREDLPGLPGFPREPLATLEERRILLAARYTAWDMIARGNACEASGFYHHVSPHLPPLETLVARARMGMRCSDFYMDDQDLLIWLAIFRVATLDQLLTMDPENAHNNHILLLEWRDRGLVSTLRVPLGEGSLEVWQLTPRAWHWLSSRYPEMGPRGMGPLRPLSAHDPAVLSSCAKGRRALHTLLQVDAIQWFQHVLRTLGGSVTNLYLERELMREGGNQRGGRFLDFRLCYGLPHGAAGSFDVEVIGTGSRYRSLKYKKYIQRCVAHRSYSGGGHRIDLGNHVCIGR